MDCLIVHRDEEWETVYRVADEIRSRMKTLGIRSLRIEGNPRVDVSCTDDVMDEYLGEDARAVHGLVLDNHDNLLMKTVPYSRAEELANECITGRECPPISREQMRENDFVPMDADGISLYALLDLKVTFDDALSSCKLPSHNN